MAMLSLYILWNTVFHSLWTAFTRRKIEENDSSTSSGIGTGDDETLESDEYSIDEDDEYSDIEESCFERNSDDEFELNKIQEDDLVIGGEYQERFSFENQQSHQDYHQEKEWSKEDDLQLFVRIRQSCLDDSGMKYDSRIEKLDWESIQFQDYSAEDCKARWLFVRRHLKPRKFLDDIIENAALCYNKRPWYHNLGLWFNNSEPLYNKFNWGVERIEYTRTITVLSSTDDSKVKLILHQYNPSSSGSI